MSDKKVVLITGASSGFGWLTAETLARRGYHVFATMRDPAGRNSKGREALEKLAASDKLDLAVLEMDVTDDESVEHAVREAVQRTGRIDVAINNAGFSGSGVTEAHTMDDLKRVFETNFFGAARVNRAVLPHMRRQRSGLLIHVSSGLGRVVLPYNVAYCASKFALEAIADCYRFELKPFGIDSVIVEPGAFRTPIFQKWAQASDQARAAEYGEWDYSRRIGESFQARHDSGKIGDPQDVVAEFVKLIEMPAGTRPFRTAVGSGVKGLAPYNEMAEVMQAGTLKAFNLPELLPKEPSR